ncbi:MAG TPA: 1-deoxy-D-xylulose-5-phosphate reductoisomerase [Bacteroidales bacterium]|nr:1-deoxy-D-xylulose-5-phosphate reductoisomerase [Bacteroidales bacterium]
MKRLAILGSTGSIGTQALDVIENHQDKFSIELLTAYSNVDKLVLQAKKFLPDTVIIVNKDHYNLLKNRLSGLPVKVYAGIEAVEQVIAMKGIDMVVAAMVGFSGLLPVIKAIEAGKDIALANKETLVVAGRIINELVLKHGVQVIPVDSEHSAILQCLAGESGNTVEKITLTASGGPFRNYSFRELKNVKPEQALKHPNWDMGNKITVDSASLMNKGLEVIEAKWFFDLEPEQIEVIIHPQSIIHSFVHFADGSIKAQLAMPDMRLPIIYALGYPDRIATELPRFDFKENNKLTFEKVDTKKFRNLALAYEALEKEGNLPCAMNAANEVAVEAFLNHEIGFLQMTELIEAIMDKTMFIQKPEIKDLEETNRISRLAAREYVEKQM